MRLSPPKQGTWLLAFLAGLLGLLAHQTPIPIVSGYSFWLVAFGFVLLVLATLFKGL